MALDKIGVILTADGVGTFTSNITKGTKALKEMQAESKKSIAALGNNAKVYDTYKTKMQGLTTQMNASKQVVVSMKEKQDALKKSVTGLESKIPELSKKLENQKSSYDKLGKSVENQKKKVEALSKSNTASTKSTQLAKEKLKELESAYKKSGSEVKQLEKEMQTLTKDIASQERQLSSLPTAIAKAETTYHNLRNEIDRTHQSFANSGGKLSDLSNKFSNAGDKLQNLGGKVNDVGNKFTLGLTTPIVSGFTLAGKAYNEMENKLNTFKGLLSDSAPNAAELNRQVSELGTSSQKMAVEYGIAGTKIRDGMEEMIKKGFTFNQTVGAMPSVLKATTASGDDFNAVMEASAGVIEQFGLKVDDTQQMLANTERVTSDITFVANKTSSGFVDLGEAMQNVGTKASLNNQTLEDTVSILGILSNANIKGGEAGTYLMNAIENLANPTKEAKKGIEALGLQVYDSQGKMRAMPQLLEDIEKATANMTDEQKNAYLSMIFNTQALKGIGPLLKAGSKQIKELSESTKDAAKYQDDLAKSMGQSSQANFNKMRESLRVLAETVGSVLIPRIIPLINKVTEFVKGLVTMDKQTLESRIKILALVAGIGPLLKILGTLTSGFGSTSKGIATFIKWIGKIQAGKTAGEIAKIGTSALSAEKGIASLGTSAAKTGSLAPLLTNPYVLGAAAITATFAGIGYYIYSEMTKDSKNHEAAVEKTEGKYQEWYDEVKKGAESSSGYIDKLSGTVKSNSEVVVSEMKKIEKANTQVMETLDSQLKKGAWYEIDGSLRTKLKEQFMLSDKDVDEITQKMYATGTLIGNSLDNITSTYLNHEKLTNEYANAQINAINDVSTKIIDGFKAQETAEIAHLDKMKANGVIQDEEYNKRVTALKDSNSKLKQETLDAQNTIKDILVKAAKESRGLTEQEMQKISESYKKMTESNSKSLTQNVEMQKELSKAQDETTVNAQINALKQAGFLSEAKEKQLKLMTDVASKAREVNKIFDEIGKSRDIALNVKYDGQNVVLHFKNDMERAANLPNIIKTIKIAEAEGRTIEMTKADLAYLNKIGISPKNVKIIDGLSGPLDLIDRKIGSLNAIPEIRKSVMLEDKASLPLKDILGYAHKLNETQIEDKKVTATDNASDPINTAKSSLDNYNNTNPEHKTLNADGNVTPFANAGTEALNLLNGTNPLTKNLNAQGNITPFTNQGTEALKNLESTNPPTKQLEANDNISEKANNANSSIRSIPTFWKSVIDVVASGPISILQKLGLFATGGSIELFAKGGNIPMFATGGSVGETSRLDKGFTGIVGEAGPELFHVSKRGVNITPLSTREKIQGISGKLEKSNQSSVINNFYIQDNIVREEADLDKIAHNIEKRFIRTLKESKNGIGGSRNVYTI